MVSVYACLSVGDGVLSNVFSSKKKFLFSSFVWFLCQASKKLVETNKQTEEKKKHKRTRPCSRSNWNCNICRGRSFIPTKFTVLLRLLLLLFIRTLTHKHATYHAEYWATDTDTRSTEWTTAYESTTVLLLIAFELVSVWEFNICKWSCAAYSFSCSQMSLVLAKNMPEYAVAMSPSLVRSLFFGSIICSCSYGYWDTMNSMRIIFISYITEAAKRRNSLDNSNRNSNSNIDNNQIRNNGKIQCFLCVLMCVRHSNSDWDSLNMRLLYQVERCFTLNVEYILICGVAHATHNSIATLA